VPLDNDIAQQHHADLVLALQGFMAKARNARTNYSVAAKSSTNLLFPRFVKIDVGQNSETLRLERINSARDKVLELAGQGSVK
jgi:hypothetical protein